MSDPIVETSNGKIQGQLRGDLRVFRGIPFAAPPVGERRWLPPEPPGPWTGVRAADSFGPICPQLPERSAIFTARGPAPMMNEDCLYLNVTSPGIDDEKRPVLFWIHGGGFTSGAGSLPVYNPRRLARRGNVVMVTINYRLSVFGFLNLNEITRGAIPATGNEGLLDQIAALDWVHQNIEAFGGDPDNVTIFGESAGAMGVANLLGTPQASGLFNRAILQSGAAHSTNSLKRATLVAENLADILGIDPADAVSLKNLTSEQLLSGLDEVNVRLQDPKYGVEGLALQPTLDNKVLTQFPLDAIKNGSAKDIPVLIGTNLDEWRFMAAMDPHVAKLDQDGLIRRLVHISEHTDVEKLIESYRISRTERGASTTLPDLFMAIQGDWSFRVPALRLTEIQHSLGATAFAYLFNWASPMAGGKLGSCHFLEVSFVFGGLDETFSGTGPEAEALRDNIQSAWLAFAANSDPAGGFLSPWPVYGNSRETMILGEKCGLSQEPHDLERQAWDSVPDSAWFSP
jgi:para-nitrobenzyl esterase